MKNSAGVAFEIGKLAVVFCDIPNDHVVLLKAV